MLGLEGGIALAAVLATVLAVASGSPLGENQRPLSTNATVSLPRFRSLEEFARIVDISYCVGITGIQQPFQCASRCDEFPGFELITTWNTGPLLSDATGYLAYDHSPDNPRIIAAFRGTYSIANTIVDLTTMPQKYTPYLPTGNGTGACSNCTVHAGFLSSWQNTRDAILSDLYKARETYPDHQLHLVGHSLGGAVALLASLELLGRGWKPITTTFGEPRVGNAAFSRHVDALVSNATYRRVTHADDPVPLLPPRQLGYAAHAAELFIAKPNLPPEPEDLRACAGAADASCSAADPAAAWRLWQLLTAHRDYFWRLGLCVKGGDPFGRHGGYGGDL